jgi:hypothetical protein
MTKKKNSKISKVPKDKPKPEPPVHTAPVSRLSIHTVFLLIGPWKKLFPHQQCGIIIAQALNNCACTGAMNIAGYLITKRRVCLVLEIDKEDINRTLMMFYDCVKKEIHQYREWIRSMEVTTNDKSKLITIDESTANLFTRYPLVNDQLVKLITGRQVNLRYYDPHLERLKDRLHNYNFCSAKDYSGAQGPVIVKLLSRDVVF